MSSTLTYPGVYIEEIPSGIRTITGVATSITAFIGRARLGPVNKAVTINNFGDFEKTFGGLWLWSKLGFAVRDFYLNGGSQAIIVRLFHPLFANEDEQARARAAAVRVASTVKAVKTTTAAKTAANNSAKAINDDKTKSAEEKRAAETVAAIINGVDNNTSRAELAKVADAAVGKAAPFPKAKLTVGEITLTAAYEGAWGANLRATVDLGNVPDRKLFNITIRDSGQGGSTERFLNLSVDSNSPRRADRVLAAESELVCWDGAWPDPSPDLATIHNALRELDGAIKADPPNPTAVVQKQDVLWELGQDTVTRAESKLARATKALKDKRNAVPAANVDVEKAAVAAAERAVEEAKQGLADAVSDGSDLTYSDFLPLNSKTKKEGLHALEQADLFSLLCIPPYKPSSELLDVDVDLIAEAATYCEQRRAMLLVDSPKDWKDKNAAKDNVDHVGTRSKNAALFFPRLKQPNPLKDNQMEEFVPCGTVAGIFARTDTQRGVWKAPAGLEAALVGVPALSVPLTDAENGELNPLGINCLRSFQVAGRVVWGSRTLRGADQLADEWKYISVRRTALFIEESLYRGTQWVVFESNDEPLWAQIRLNIGAFMHNLFRQGAFQGKTPREAYFVKCDSETTTQSDINLGIVNIAVGFAPLKPAEFVVIKLQQMAGQIAT